jgi:arginine utilization regulatory protein
MERSTHVVISELEQEIEDLKRENELLKAIIDSTHEAIYAVNENDEIILYNQEAEKM